MTLGGNSKEQLKSFVDRIDHLMDEAKVVADDIKDLYAEAKGQGLNTKALRTIIRIRREDFEKRREQEAIVETYMHALGMLADTPLGEAAIKSAVPGAALPNVDTSTQPF